MSEEIGVLIIAGCLAVLILLGAIAWYAVSCGAIGTAMSLSSKYNLMTGCMIQADKKWVPLKNYREFGQ